MMEEDSSQTKKLQYLIHVPSELIRFARPASDILLDKIDPCTGRIFIDKWFYSLMEKKHE